MSEKGEDMPAWELHELPALTCPWCFVDNKETNDEVYDFDTAGKTECRHCKKPFHWELQKRYWTRKGDA